MSQSHKPHLLVIENDPTFQSHLIQAFECYEVIVANDRAEAIAKLRRFVPGVVTLNLNLSPNRDPEEGFNTLKEIISLAPETKVIVITEQTDRKIAMRTIHLGAYDFYTKPIDAQILKLIIERAFYLHQLEKESKQGSGASLNHTIKGIVTGNLSMQKVCQMVQKVAPKNITILFLGESGTGKEVLAKALHENSDRANGPFVAINCAAIPETLLESELFGYEKGAFTGAVKQTLGKIESAH
ncbi:MAG: sigma 54-interacting transcriptional regulator, partial [Candidatus Berkiellales bacterium]